VSASPDRAFWPRAQGAPLVLLTDFDFTISQVDVGNLICDTLAPYPPAALARFGRGEIGSRALWLESFAKVDPAEAAGLAEQVEIDPGFKAFAAWAEAEQIPLAVASDGFTLYIDRILGREGLGHLPVFSNRYVGRDQLEWPHANPACDFCGCCKAAVARHAKEAGAYVVYLGDGVSDLYAAGFADWVFAKGTLARFMREHQAPYFPLTGFDAALGVLRPNLHQFRNGTMERRNTLRPHPRCRFADLPVD